MKRCLKRDDTLHTQIPGRFFVSSMAAIYIRPGRVIAPPYCLEAYFTLFYLLYLFCLMYKMPAAPGGGVQDLSLVRTRVWGPHARYTKTHATHTHAHTTFNTRNYITFRARTEHTG